jgi:hypothetical protein
MTAALGNLDEQKMRDIAERLEADNPLWMVMFGVYSRQFVAFARFDSPSGHVLSAHYPAALPDRMRAVERQARELQPEGVATQDKNP